MALLREVDVAIEPHNLHFAKTLDDHIWIPEVARRGWAIISGDKRIESGINRVAVVESAAKVFILSETNSRPIFWGAAFITGLNAILRCVQNNNGPFFADISRDSAHHVGYPRFAAHGGPIHREADLDVPVEREEKQIVQIKESSRTERQPEFNFPQD